MVPLFQTPDEALLAPILAKYPCRQVQIRALTALLHPQAAPCANVVLHGTEATGKSVIASAVLEAIASSLSPPSPFHSLATSLSSSSSPTLHYAIVKSAQCVTARHLFERVVGTVADALAWPSPARRCETLAQLAVELEKMLHTIDPGERRGRQGRQGRRNGWTKGGDGQEYGEEDGEGDKAVQRESPGRFVLALDGIDAQRDAPATLLPGLARLPEMIPSLTCLFIVTSPPPSFLRLPAVPHIDFPQYAKPEFVEIMSLAGPPPRPRLPGAAELEVRDLWVRFCAAVHDALARPAARALPAFRHGCRALWPRFVAPVLAGNCGAKEFSKLLIAARAHFQDESLLNPGLIAVRPAIPITDGTTTTTTMTTTTTTTTTTTSTTTAATTTPDLSVLLPRTARLLLLAAYLASHNPPRHDVTLFSTHHHGKRRRRGGIVVSSAPSTPGRRGSKHRKIARRLLGAHAFVLERMMAIFAAVRTEWIGGGAVTAGLDADVAMALATLASLRLLVRVGAGAVDAMDRGGKWRINVGWDVVRGVGRSIGVELDEWLIE